MIQENALFFLAQYSQGPSCDVILRKLLTGELGPYMSNFIIAEFLFEILEEDEIAKVNMWKTEEVAIFTFQDTEENCGVIFVKPLHLRRIFYRWSFSLPTQLRIIA